MRQELGKYYLRYAWYPKRLSNGQLIWFRHYYEAQLDTLFVDPVYTRSRLSEEDFLIGTLRGDIVNGYDPCGISYDRERMLNAADSSFQE